MINLLALLRLAYYGVHVVTLSLTKDDKRFEVPSYRFTIHDSFPHYKRLLQQRYVLSERKRSQVTIHALMLNETHTSANSVPKYVRISDPKSRRTTNYSPRTTTRIGLRKVEVMKCRLESCQS